jgi:hypothetical protein
MKDKFMLNTISTPINKIKFYNASRALNWSVSWWILIALLGQWLFALYIALLYALPFFKGNYQATRLTHPITGYVSGDAGGNAIYFSHILPAAIISICGIFQLLPIIRKRFPSFHRWNGRVFLSLGLMGALTGLYLTWVRGSRLSDLGAVGITVNGLLIPVAVYFAWKFARMGHFTLHQRIAIHAFLLINGVWSFRLYLMAWYMANQGTFGNSNNLDGPADIFLSYACYLLPMSVAELYFWARRQNNNLAKWWVVGVISTGSLVTLFGIVAASIILWWPRIQQAV